MSNENINDAVEAVDEAAVEVVEAVEVAADDYDAAVVEEVREPVVIDRPIQTVGRRKEAVVRVRLAPGSGEFTLNGRSLEDYFPNKVHQQLIKAPLVTVERTESFDKGRVYTSPSPRDRE